MGEMKTDEAEHQKKLEEQHKNIKKLLEKPLKNDDSWYLLDANWYGQWEKYVTNDGSWYSQTDKLEFHPGHIDNTPLFDDNKDLREHLVENVEYKLIPKDAWELLTEEFGLMEEQLPIERKVIEEGIFANCVVEIYPIRLQLCNFADKEKCVSKVFSRITEISELEKEMRHQFEISSKQETRLWDASIEDNHTQLDRNKTIENVLQKGQLVIMEVKNDDGKWPQGEKQQEFTSSMSTRYNGSSSGSSTMSSTSGYGLRNYQSYSSGRKKLTMGLCGLNNLGNTCFMNSALQCLSNVPTLTKYFKSGEYKNELNPTNPLGMGGKIAKTYANLIQMIWSGDHSSYAPRDFKMAVGQFQSRFLGYQQQDSQELLAFLIDGLHEDLNRISKKPYIEAKDADGRPDNLVASEAWENHRKRNNSIIVDILHGLFRSIVDCPECPRVSVTFDPFCFLSLPLPVKREISIECTFVPLAHDEDMMKYKVTAPKSGIVRDIYKALSELNSVPYTNMTATDIYNSRFHKVCQGMDQIRSIHDNSNIFVYESVKDATMIPVYMRHASSIGNLMLFGQPLLIPVDIDNTTYKQLYLSVLKATCRYLNDDSLKDEIEALVRGGDDELKMDCKDASQNDAKEDEENGDSLFDLFRIKVINSYGSQEFKNFEDNSEPLKLSGTMYLSADWTKSAYQKSFPSLWDNRIEIHESAQPGAMKKPPGGVNLLNCMELFTSKEQLGKENTWYCSNCKEHRQAYKKFDLWMLPPVLIIHLKRFSNTRYTRDKLDTFIDFPIKNLDLSDFVVNPNTKNLQNEKRRYNLIAVSNHYGGLGGGHYTAFAKNNVDKQWHYFDDSSVSLSSEERVVTKAAYMLVYQRQDLEAWLDKNSTEPFPFLEPIISPRAAGTDPTLNGKSFNFGREDGDEDILNNNNTEDAMDTT